MKTSARHIRRLLGINHPLLTTSLYLADEDESIPSLNEMIETGINSRRMLSYQCWTASAKVNFV